MNLLNNLTTGAHSKRVGYFSTIGADTKSKHAGGLEVKYQNGLKAATKEAFHLGEPTTSNEKTNLGKAMIALAIDADVDIKLNTNETTDKDIIRTIGNYVKEKLATAKKDKQILPQETRTLVKNMCLILNVAKEANNNSEVFGASRTKGVGVYDNKSGAWKGVSDKVVSGNAWESYFQDVLACDTQDVQKEARSGIDRVKHNTPGLEGRGDTRDENVAQMYGNVNGNSVEAQATASPTMSGPISRLFGWAGQSVTKGEEADLKKSMENLFLKATTYLDPDPNQMVGSGHPTINGVPVMPDTSGNNAASTSGKRAPAALNNAAGTSVKGPPTGEFNKLSKVDSLNSEMTLEQIRDQGRRGASATSTSGNNAAGDAVGTAAGSKANAAGTAAENNVASQEGPATSVNNAAGTVASTSVNNTTSTAETTGPSRESVLQENIEALNDGEIPDFVRELEPEDIAIVKNMDVSNPSENLTMVKNQITRNEIENEFDGVATARYYGFQEEQTHNSQLFEGILKRYEAAGGSTGDLLGRFGKDEDSFSNLLYRVTNETALTFSNLIIDEFISDESIKNLVTGKSTKDQKTQNLKAAMQFIMNNELFKGKLFTDDGTQLNEQSKTKQLLDLARVKDNELVGAFKKFARNINSVVKEQMGWRTTTFEGIYTNIQKKQKEITTVVTGLLNSCKKSIYQSFIRQQIGFMIDEGWYNLTDASKQAFVKSFNPDDLTGTVVDVLNEDLRWDNYKSQQNSNANSNPIDPASSNQTNTSATANQTTASGVAAANQTAESAAANQTTASGVASTDTAGTTLPSQKEMAARRNVLVELQGRMSKIEGAASVPIGALNQQPSIAGNASVTIGALKETPTTVGNLTDIQDNPTEYMNALKGDIEQRLTAAGTTLTNGTIEVNERGRYVKLVYTTPDPNKPGDSKSEVIVQFQKSGDGFTERFEIAESSNTMRSLIFEKDNIQKFEDHAFNKINQSNNNQIEINNQKKARAAAKKEDLAQIVKGTLTKQALMANPEDYLATLAKQIGMPDNTFSAELDPKTNDYTLNYNNQTIGTLKNNQESGGLRFSVEGKDKNIRYLDITEKNLNDFEAQVETKYKDIKTAEEKIEKEQQAAADKKNKEMNTPLGSTGTTKGVIQNNPGIYLDNLKNKLANDNSVDAENFKIEQKKDKSGSSIWQISYGDKPIGTMKKEQASNMKLEVNSARGGTTFSEINETNVKRFETELSTKLSGVLKKEHENAPSGITKKTPADINKNPTEYLQTLKDRGYIDSFSYSNDRKTITITHDFKMSEGITEKHVTTLTSKKKGWSFKEGNQETGINGNSIREFENGLEKKFAQKVTDTMTQIIEKYNDAQKEYDTKVLDTSSSSRPKLEEKDLEAINNILEEDATILTSPDFNFNLVGMLIQDRNIGMLQTLAEIDKSNGLEGQNSYLGAVNEYGAGALFQLYHTLADGNDISEEDLLSYLDIIPQNISINNDAFEKSLDFQKTLPLAKAYLAKGHPGKDINVEIINTATVIKIGENQCKVEDIQNSDNLKLTITVDNKEKTVTLDKTYPVTIENTILHHLAQMDTIQGQASIQIEARQSNSS